MDREYSTLKRDVFAFFHFYNSVYILLSQRKYVNFNIWISIEIAWTLRPGRFPRIVQFIRKPFIVLAGYLLGLPKAWYFAVVLLWGPFRLDYVY